MGRGGGKGTREEKREKLQWLARDAKALGYNSWAEPYANRLKALDSGTQVPERAVSAREKEAGVVGAPWVAAGVRVAEAVAKGEGPRVKETLRRTLEGAVVLNQLLDTSKVCKHLL